MRVIDRLMGQRPPKEEIDLWNPANWQTWFEANREDVLQIVDEDGHVLAAEKLQCPKGLLAQFHAKRRRPASVQEAIDQASAETAEHRPIGLAILDLRTTMRNYLYPSGKLNAREWIPAHADQILAAVEVMKPKALAQNLDIGYSTLTKYVKQIRVARKAAIQPPLEDPGAFKESTGFDLPKLSANGQLHDRYADALFEVIARTNPEPFSSVVISAMDRLERILGISDRDVKIGADLVPIKGEPGPDGVPEVER